MTRLGHHKDFEIQGANLIIFVILLTCSKNSLSHCIYLNKNKLKGSKEDIFN